MSQLVYVGHFKKCLLNPPSRFQKLSKETRPIIKYRELLFYLIDPTVAGKRKKMYQKPKIDIKT